MRRLAVLLSTLAALVGPRGASAMFEDQAGTYDWYRSHIGLVENAYFHPTKPRICFSTAQSVVGCLNLRDGSVAWRKVLGTGPSYILMSSKSQKLIAACDGFLRCFDLEGNLQWQRTLQNVTSAPTLTESPGASDRVTVMQRGQYQVGGSGVRGQENPRPKSVRSSGDGTHAECHSVGRDWRVAVQLFVRAGACRGLSYPRIRLVQAPYRISRRASSRHAVSFALLILVRSLRLVLLLCFSPRRGREQRSMQDCRRARY
jgi:hypothetical protein